MYEIGKSIIMKRTWRFQFRSRQMNYLEIFIGELVKKQSLNPTQNIKEEMADILIYLLQLADKMEINLEEEVSKKLVKNAIISSEQK